MDYILKECPNKYGLSTNINPFQKLDFLAYADDIVLLDNSSIKVFNHLNDLKKEAAKINLHINSSKTKYITNIPGNNKLDGEIERVDEFKYLGVYIMSTQTEFKRRKSLALACFWKMRKIWHSKMLNINLKIKIFKSTILSIFFYGCESWIINKKLENKINAFGNNCLRYILKIKREDKRKIYK